MSQRLEALPNVGSVLADRLRSVGIRTAEELVALGDGEAFARIRADLAADACTHTRLALAGAVRGVRWKNLGKDLRLQLTRELEQS